MTLREFRYLSNEEQDRALQTEAVYLADFADKEGTCILFQLNGFYLEVLCRGGEKCTVNYFDEIDLLEPYLELVNIDPVYEILGLW